MRVQMRVAWVSMGAERKFHGSDGAEREGGGGRVEGAVSRGAGYGDFLQGVAAGSGVADVDEQPGSGGSGKTGRIDCVWPDGEGGEELGVLSRHCEVAAGVGGGRDSAGAIGQAGGNFSDARVCAACAAVQFKPGGSLEQLGQVP